MTTLLATLGPVLLTTRKYVQLLRTTTGSGVSTRLKPRFAAGPTIVDAIAELFPGNGSAWNARASEVTLTEPSATGVAVIDTVAFAPLTRLIRLALTTLPLMVTEPWEDTAFCTTNPADRVFVTVTPEAVEGPRFVTETV